MRKISKFLSFILRHKPQEIDLVLDENGWADVEELLHKSTKKGVSFSRSELEQIVATNEKKRFAFNDDKTKIRANQGHSIDVNLDLKPITPPQYLYHGTANANISVILQNGILKMNRQHVHLSSDEKTALQVGSRHGKPKVLTIMAAQMHTDNMQFYQSENGVWLTDYIAPKYILQE